MNEQAFAIIKAQLGQAVPFARHAGVEVVSVEDGAAKATIEQTDVSINHIGSQHAGALFTLGETASGAAMMGAFAEKALQIRPIAGQASIRYTKVAKGPIVANATTSLAGSDLRETLEADGKVVFAVDVELVDDTNEQVATMSVDWHVRLG